MSENVETFFKQVNDILHWRTREMDSAELQQLEKGVPIYAENVRRVLSYNNPDFRCTYPFTPDPVGYCWSYAHHVDGTLGFQCITTHCIHCELFSPNTAVEIQTEGRDPVEVSRGDAT